MRTTWGYVLACVVLSCGGGGGGAPDANVVDPDAELDPDAERDPDAEPGVFTVRVTVGGLDGSLVLRNNGGDDLTVNADGTHPFATTLADGAPFAVTVEDAPASQRCAVAGGSGDIDGADVIATVTCADKSWAFPTAADQGITPVADNEAYEPYVGMDDAGDAVVAFYGGDGTTACGGDPCNRVFVSERNDGVWTHPTGAASAITPAGYQGEQARVSVAGNGDAVVAYPILRVPFCLQPSDQPCMALYRSDRRGGVWTHPANLDAYYSFAASSTQQSLPRLNATGGGMLLWRQGTTSYDRAYSSEYTGGTWVDPADDTYAFGFAKWPVTAFEGGYADNGDYVVTWGQIDDSGGCGNPTSGCEQIYVAERRGVVETGPSGFTNYISFAGAHAVGPIAAVNSAGRAIVVWRQYDGTTACGGQPCGRIAAADIRSDGRTLPSSLTDSISFAGAAASDYRTAIDDAGDAIVVWTQDDGTAYRLYRAERRGGVWTLPASQAAFINPAGSSVDKFEVAMDDLGNAIIVWSQSDGTTACGGAPCVRVFLAEYRGGAWTGPASLADAVSLPGLTLSGTVSVGMSNFGDALLAWDSFDAATTTYAVFVASFR